jgi:hypothetical protein
LAAEEPSPWSAIKRNMTMRPSISSDGFRTDINKIYHLVQTVDQEVGGSNPPSCTKHLALKMQNRCDIWCKVPVSTFAPIDLVIRQTLFDDPA